MKKTILTLMVLLVCAIQTATAYEYFTIYFSNGTKSEAFYATDVDSICYSKFNLDSIEYADWQVQEIYTCDSVYRYPLAQIDSLSFKDVDVNEVADNMANINTIIVPIYARCNSTKELSQYLSAILPIKGVEDAWTDDQSLFVKVRNWGIMTFSYPPTTEYEEITLPNMSRTMSTNNTHYASDYKACIINQMYNDKSRPRPKNASEKISKKFENMGIAYKIENYPLALFFQNDIFDYDLIFLMTHGDFDGHSHWLYTSEELLSTRDIYEEVDYVKIDSLACNLLKKKYPNYSPKMMSTGWQSEIREGEKTIIWYIKISEHFIAAADRNFNNRYPVVFNLACQSLKGNPKLAKVFLDKGAKCYLGYTETNSIGAEGGESFFNNLMNGKCAYGAKKIIPTKWCTELYKGTATILEMHSNNEQTTLDYSIIKPETLPAEIINSDETIIKMKGCFKILDPYSQEAKSNKYGFVYGENPNPSINSESIVGGDYGYDKQSHNVMMEYDLKESRLKPNTTYYYRAYMNDGFSNSYGEIKSFTTQGDAEAYAVRYSNDPVITYYYDGKKKERKGYEVPYHSSDVETVIFDASFANFKPTSTAGWFRYMRNLTSIQNINYLSTENVTDMHEMFSWCTSLTNLDLSSFNTANVINMESMFYNCESLKSLNVSSFNVSNVTNMKSMFAHCKSLSSLNLSNFNTVNVTNMEDLFRGCNSLSSLTLKSFRTANVKTMAGMFHTCSSLKSLDLSNFNTSNVTYMYGMFMRCRSLTYLNLRSFNTKKVTNVAFMFEDCSSLMNLDLSSFNTANVTETFYMFRNCNSLKIIYAGNWVINKLLMSGHEFSGCENLVGGKGTKIGQNLYGYDKDGTPLYYYCPDDERAARIDGGKDYPGLFTAK